MFLLGVVSLTSSILAQASIFPNLYGEDLLTALRQSYTPSTVLGYNAARDLMYGQLDNRNDSITCVYTGYQVYVPFNSANPRNFTNAANPIMNAEHTWPQSKGASSGTNARSDLHHLFPTNGDANAGRSSFPFAEINDASTDRWYRKTSTTSQIPTVNIDEYSELHFNTAFEAREDHKGNVARAMFYFYTIYKDLADAADPAFFGQQKTDLRRWNAMDPVDAAEIARTEGIASAQDGKVNPFVIDTSLIGRAYFGVVSGTNNENGFPVIVSVTLQPNYPNPFNPQTTIEFELPAAAGVTLDIYDNIGQHVATPYRASLPAGTHQFLWNATDAYGNPVASGIYYYRLRAASFVQTRKMLLIR